MQQESDYLVLFSLCPHFFYKQLFYKRRQAKIGKKNQANPKQHPRAELLLFEIYSHFSCTLSSKNIWHILKKSKHLSVSVFMRL